MGTSPFGTWSESSLWASVLWGAVASGYFIYGWKQKSMIPFIAGIIMTAASFLLSWLSMSVVCIVTIWGAWWWGQRF